MFDRFIVAFLFGLAAGNPSSDDNAPSSLVADAPESLEYLKRYGYLNKDGPSGEVAAASLYSMKSVESALKQAQKFGGLPQTGILDEATKKLFETRRCGLPDVERNATHQGRRRKRFILTSQSWKKRRLTYFLTNWSPKLTRSGVMTELRKAFDAWSKYSRLVFTESRTPSEADINIGFYRGHHGDNTPFDGNGNVLAHAFYPNDGLGGDIHFDDDEDWTINPGEFDEGVDFSAVALHELGHSLGLSHSPEQGSIMNPYYKAKKELGYDDILAMHELYISRRLEEEGDNSDHQDDDGATREPEVPNLPTTPRYTERPHFPDRPHDRPRYPHYPRFPHYPHYHHPFHHHHSHHDHPRPTRPTSEETRPTYEYTTEPTRKTTNYFEVTYEGDDESVERHKDHDHTHGIPPREEPCMDAPSEDDGCRGGFDTVAFFRGELFVIKNKMLWRLSEPGKVLDGYPLDFHRLFSSLPKSLEKIDAIYERSEDSSIMIFSGKRYWIYDGFEFLEGSPRPITDYGLPEEVDSVDAVLSGGNSEVFVFKSDRFWTFNETTKSPVSKNPKPLALFKGLPDNLDAALLYKEEKYFIKGDDFWVSDDKSGLTVRKYPVSASNFWIAC